MTDKLPYPERADPGAMLDWAQRLVAALQRPDKILLKLDRFKITVRLPDATKVGDGCVIFVDDAAGGAVPAYSRNGQWLRFDTNAVVS